ncbi:LysR substrate-binding domain-containing protein [Paracoccus sanguinis]|uniref:LysR substrate-binding domain-containing protein n=1 Tax=Paracoccus sanguinis TaxID=1545044 RepID=UPI001451F967|nr:LysR substrate-binding domain-containing protein [Paracoccus sanguinis]QJD16497.1 LysR family transcriptional regulator [Paracoccus sanguinis]
MLRQRSLEVFEKVMRYASASDAAREMNISASAVSRHLRELELTTGLQLFARTGNSLTPTAQAFHLLAEVERAFVGLRDIEGRLGQIARGVRQRMIIGAMPVLSTGIMPDVMAGLARRDDEFTVELQTARTSNIVPRVMGGVYDAGAIALFHVTTDLQVVWKHAFPYYCILPADDSLLARRDEIVPADLAGQTLISFAANTTTGSQLDRLFADLPRPPLIRFWVHMSAAASEMVLRGLGVSIVDPFAALHHARRGGVVRRFMSPAAFTVGMVTRSGAEHSIYQRALVAELNELSSRLESTENGLKSVL